MIYLRAGDCAGPIAAAAIVPAIFIIIIAIVVTVIVAFGIYKCKSTM